VLYVFGAALDEPQNQKNQRMITSTAITRLSMLEGTATSLHVIRLTCTQHSGKAGAPKNPGLQTASTVGG
jgi:hypothetical protein